MSNNRYDLLAPIPRGDGKTFWLRIGVAFAERNGTGFKLLFDVPPPPANGKDGRLEICVLMRPPREAGDRPAPQKAGGHDDSSDIPF